MAYIYTIFLFFTLLGSSVSGGVANLFQIPDIRVQLEAEADYQLGVVLIFKNEAPYLKEWIEYHHMLGVERFYLYNNLSTDNYKKVLEPYIKKGWVRLIEYPHASNDVPSWNAVQCCAYAEAIQIAVADRVKWLAVIDSDEFLVPRTDDSLTEYLAKYENDTIGGLRVLWVMFGTSYVKKIPKNKTMIETLVLNEGYINGMWKSIVRPNRVNPNILGGCHTQSFLEGYHDVTVPVEEIQCNHYWTRDEYYLYNFKIPRRMTWGTPADVCLTWKDSFNHETPAGDAILRFVPKLRKEMGFK